MVAPAGAVSSDLLRQELCLNEIDAAFEHDLSIGNDGGREAYATGAMRYGMFTARRRPE
jgi:hypothetical protein